MTDSRSITGVFVFSVILMLAIWLGISIVTNQIKTLGYVSACATIIVCALLGRRVWMIIPFAMAFDIKLMVAGQPSTLLIAEALFCGFCVSLILLRKLHINLKFNELHLWVLLLCACVAQAYVRNPVGLNIFGGETIGARPYVIFAVSLTTWLFLAHLRIPQTDLKWYLRLHIVGGIMNFAILATGNFIPRLGVWYGSVNTTALTSGTYQEGSYGIERASRINFVRDISRNIALWVSSFKSPVMACFHPIWAPLVAVSFAFAAFSGFRNEIIAVGLTYLVGIFYRGGLPSIIVATATLIVGIALLSVINLATPLPVNVQRSLSFIPGTWDEYQKKDAANSTQWRVDMWEAALSTDYWIKNKFLGDGLGMTKQEFNFIQSVKGGQISGQVGTGKLNLDQELMMVSNNYHSGPVSTIRNVGYVGLLILLIAQIRLAVHAHRQIKRAINSEWFPLTLLVGIPVIWAPFFFTFIVGSFGSAISTFLLGSAFVHILNNNLPLPTISREASL